MQKRKEKITSKLIKDTAKNAATLVLLIIGLFLKANELVFGIDGIPSNLDIVRAFNCGVIPYVELADGEACVSFIDVGQGDCELIRTKNHNILIDSGEENYAGEVVTFLKYAQIETLDMIIVTHPHTDHYGGMYKIINEFNVVQMILPEDIPVTIEFAKLLNSLEKQESSIRYAEPGDKFELEEDSYLEILAPFYDDYDEANNFSIVSRFVHGEKSFLFTGDLERMGELDLLELGVDVNADVLKVPHHGSAGSCSEEFLRAVTPEIAVFEASEGNYYYHPRKEVIYRLKDVGCTTTYSTSNNGNIVIISDGKSLRTVCEYKSALEL